MNSKASKRGFKKEKHESKLMITFIVASSAVMVIHYCIWFEQKVSCEGLFWGGGVKVYLK